MYIFNMKALPELHIRGWAKLRAPVVESRNTARNMVPVPALTVLFPQEGD